MAEDEDPADADDEPETPDTAEADDEPEAADEQTHEESADDETDVEDEADVGDEAKQEAGEEEAAGDEEEADEEDEHPVTLGKGESVEGVPLAQVSARLMWGIERSQIRRREGETVVRTPDGPRQLGDILDEIELTYFEKRQEFEDAVREVVGTGPIPTE